MRHFGRVLTAWLGLTLAATGLLGPATAWADGTSWMAGPGAVGDDTFAGFIDTPQDGATVPTGNFPVSGWFVDRTAEGWAGADNVQVFVGEMGNGGRLLATASFAQDRPDVAAAEGNSAWADSGFSAEIPGGALQPGSQTLSVYAHTPDKGWWYRSVGVTVSAGAPTVAASNPAPSTPVPLVSHTALPIIVIEVPTASQNITTELSFEIIGYALDKNAGPSQGVQGSGVDRVQVYLDGPRGEPGSESIGDATLGYSDQTAASLYGPQFAAAGWRATFNPTNFHKGVHTIFAYARSAVSGKEDLALQGFNDSNG